MYSEPVEGGMSLSHRLALSDVLNSLQEHLVSIVSRQVRRVEFRLYETKGEFLPQLHCIYFDFHWHIYTNTLKIHYLKKKSRLFNETKIIFLII